MDRLKPEHFSFRCPMNFDAMAPSENGRFCDKCRKEVFDLTDCSVDEVIELQKKHGSICGSIRIAAVGVALSAAACQPVTRTTGKPVPPNEPKKIVRLGGTVCVNPSKASQKETWAENPETWPKH